MTAPFDPADFITPPGGDVISDEDLPLFAAAAAQDWVTPVFPQRGPPEIDALEMDAMVIAAGFGRPQPAGLSPQAAALWPQIKAEIEEILANPEATGIDYPSEAIDVG